MILNSYTTMSLAQPYILSGSYIPVSDELLLNKQIGGSNIWYGKSEKDVIELSVWDLTQEFLAWGTISGSTSVSSSISYLNELNYPSTQQSVVITDKFVKFNNSKILINPEDDLTSIGYSNTGSYYLAYNMTRNMVGNLDTPLVVKEISPSRTEIKVLPQKDITSEFISFSEKKIIVTEVYEEYIGELSVFPISTIYNEIKPKYQTEINTLQTISFLKNDGDVIDFINNIYEDSYIYSAYSNNAQLTRIQGIKLYFFNYLISNLQTITTFENLDAAFDAAVNSVLDIKFKQIKNIENQAYQKAKQFIHDLIKVYYYQPISDALRKSYGEIYSSPLKNALNFGNNTLIPILNHGKFVEPDGSFSLIVKLKDPLSNDISIGSTFWISNISIDPAIILVSLNDFKAPVTFKIGSPNFTLKSKNTSTATENKKYSIDDLRLDVDTDRSVQISKKIKELNVDYTDFSKFVVFSSVEVRLKIFKNKAINISNLQSSVNTLNSKNQQFIQANNSPYPFYQTELDSINSQIDSIVDSFDGYESYLYNSGNYKILNGEFVYSDIVNETDVNAIEYDKNNQDSLIKNTPDYILKDVNNDDYLIFLSMIGHFFDNIYIYVSTLPYSKQVGFTESEMLSQQMVNVVLEELGWDIEDILSDDSIASFYTADNVNSSIDSNTQIKIIQNRVLKNLPLIYKSKGTETSIKLLLSCYGIPSSLLNIREYGGYSFTSSGSYTFNEKSYMYSWDKSSPYDRFTLDGITDASSYLFKVCFDDSTLYKPKDDNILLGVINPTYPASSSISGSGEWAVGFVKTDIQDNARMYFRLGYKNQEIFKLTSDEFPLFNGDVYSVLIRKNDIDPVFTLPAGPLDLNAIPRKYDFFVKNNKSGETVLHLSSSNTNYDYNSNVKFDGISGSRIVIGGWFRSWNSTPLVGAFDKFQVFSNAISDDRFNDYVNNINSYANNPDLDASELLFRMHVDYPFDINSSSIWKNSNTVYSNYLTNYNGWAGEYSASYNTASCSDVNVPIYPFQFKVLDYANTINVSDYGPNQFHNQKINRVDQEVLCRLDAQSTSARNIEQSVPSSNQLGIFLDPQDFKNKDIVRQLGNYDLMGLIGDPSNSFESQYIALGQLRAKYVQSKKSTKQTTLFSELMTIYKLYFNKSIFDSIKNLLPARVNVFDGILIEPTILERPKYQFKQLNGQLNTGESSFQETSLNDGNLINLSSEIEYMDVDTFNSNDFDISITSIENKSSTYDPVSYFPYALDDYQLGAGINSSNKYLSGYCNTTSSMYILKRWKKYSQVNPTDSIPNSASYVYLYDYVIMSERSYFDLVYTSSVVNLDPGQHGSEVGSQWRHNPLTFKGTPNATVNNYGLTRYQVGSLTIYDLPAIQFLPDVYFEINKGYPRNHISHKRPIFSSYTSFNTKKKTHYKKSQQTVSQSIAMISGSYPTISSSIDIEMLKNSSNPVIILTQDAIGTLN